MPELEVTRVEEASGVGFKEDFGKHICNFFFVDFPDGIEDDGFYSKVFEIDLVKNLVKNLKYLISSFMLAGDRRRRPLCLAHSRW